MPRDFEKAPLRGRFEAWMLDASSARFHRLYGDRKQEAIGAMTGTIVELGPGSGANMAYYRDGVKVIGIEPNPAMHDRVRARALEFGVDYKIRTLYGESIDVEDHEADAVVATLVLCGVDDPAQVLSEIKRILKPGGSYFFLEHVAAPQGSWMRRAQSLVNRPHRWVFNSCEVDRETGSLLTQSGFGSIELDELDAGPSGLYVADFVVGAANA